MYFQENQVVVESFVIPIWGIVLGAIGIYFLISCITAVLVSGQFKESDYFDVGYLGLLWPIMIIVAIVGLFILSIGKIGAYIRRLGGI